MANCYCDIDVILADDHELFRRGFDFMIKQNKGINLIAEARDGKELIKQVEKNNPDVIITDIRMPCMNGIEATKYLTNNFPNIGVIVLSGCEEDQIMTAILEAGAKGYILKNADEQEMINGIKCVNTGQTYYCKNTLRRLNEIKAIKNAEPYFSPREIMIIKLICTSHSSQEIGNYLELSRRTVEGYRERIMQKLEVDKTIDIVLYAIKHKIYQFENIKLNFPSGI